MPKRQNTRKPQSRTAARQAQKMYEQRLSRRARILRLIGALFAALIVAATVIGLVASNLSALR